MSRKPPDFNRLALLGSRLRDLVLDVRIYHNRGHDRPGWEEITDYSRTTWTRVAEAMLSAGWRPPLDWEDARGEV